jgi:hypothetical protein
MIYRDFQDEEKEEGVLYGALGDVLGEDVEGEDGDETTLGADVEEEEKEWE